MTEQIFTSNGTFTVPSTVNKVDVLVVGGGGSAGREANFNLTYAGGGGAGGLVFEEDYTVTPSSTIDIVIGAGGAEKTSSGSGNDGSNSSFGTLIALGGGGGAGGDGSGRNGGSGGGGASTFSGDKNPGSGLQPASASGGFGNDGATGTGGGGGGAGGQGSGGTGGVGKDVWGVTYATGGSRGTTVAGSANTGDGGGSRANNDGGNGLAGGSGIVIVRYLEPTVDAKPATDITYEGATLNSEITEDQGEDCEVRFRYKATGDWINTSWDDNGGLFYRKDDTPTYAFDGIAGVTYEFQVQIKNINGESVWSSSETFTLTAAVETKAATAIELTKATLNGEVLISTADAYFEYKKTTDLDWIATTPATETGEYSDSVIGLESNKQYEFRAVIDYGVKTSRGEILTFFAGNYESAVLTLTNIKGDFITGEVFEVIGSDTEGSINSEITQGKNNLFSEYGALTLPRGNNPVAMIGIGTDIAITAMKKNSHATLFLWDTFATSFYRDIHLPYPQTTAMLSHNGIPYIWGGDDDGYSLYRFLGGNQVENLFYIDNGYPPLQGAVDAQQDRIIWGSYMTTPDERGAVMAWGSKAKLPAGLHCIATTPNQIGAINFNGELLVSDTTKTYKSGTEIDSIWRSEIISFGEPFDTTNEGIVMTLSRELVDAESITITLYFDNEEKSEEYVITNADCDGRTIKIFPEHQGIHNLMIEFKTEIDISLLLPIKINYVLHG